MSSLKRCVQAIREWVEMFWFIVIAGFCRLLSGKSPFGWEDED